MVVSFSSTTRLGHETTRTLAYTPTHPELVHARPLHFSSIHVGSLFCTNYAVTVSCLNSLLNSIRVSYAEGLHFSALIFSDLAVLSLYNIPCIENRKP